MDKPPRDVPLTMRLHRRLLLFLGRAGPKHSLLGPRKTGLREGLLDPRLVGSKERPLVPRRRELKPRVPLLSRAGLKDWLRVLLLAGLLLVGSGGILLAEASDLVSAGRVVGGNYAVNEGAADPLDISAHNSPSIVQNPVNPENLVASDRVDSPLFSCALHISKDGGSTWSQTPLPVPEGEEAKCYAPDVAFSTDGTLYLSFVTLKGLGNVPNAVWIISSRDGGLTLSEPSQAFGPLAFQVRLTSSPSEPDHLQLTWLQAEVTATFSFPETGNPIMWATSEDGGATWSTPTQVNDDVRERVVAPSHEVLSDGRVLVLFLDLGEDRLDYEGAHGGQGGPPYDGYWSLILARSEDDGRTWRESVVDDRVVPTERFVVFIPPSPSLAADPDSEHVYVAFQEGSNNDPDVKLWRSDDGGRTFSDPVRVNDTPQGDGTSQYLPEVQTAPGGRLDVVYLDRRADPNDVMTEVSLQSSFDNGDSFSRRILLTDRAFDPRIGPGVERGMPSLGSRLALLSVDRAAIALWPDTRRGTIFSNRQDLAQAVIEMAGPPPLSSRLGDVFRTGGLAGVGVSLLLAGYFVWQKRRHRDAPKSAELVP
ncbi:MAG: sialidase family protein [Actinomycetota bacterium]